MENTGTQYLTSFDAEGDHSVLRQAAGGGERRTMEGSFGVSRQMSVLASPSEE